MVGKRLVQMFVGSVGIISRLDSQIKLQMFAPFSDRHVGGAKSFIEHSGSILGSENLRYTFRRISKVWENAETQNLFECLLYQSPVTLQLLDFIH